MKTRDLKRLIADDDKILRNTETGVTAHCVDVFIENINKWEEIEDKDTNEEDKNGTL